MINLSPWPSTHSPLVSIEVELILSRWGTPDWNQCPDHCFGNWQPPANREHLSLASSFKVQTTIVRRSHILDGNVECSVIMNRQGLQAVVWTHDFKVLSSEPVSLTVCMVALSPSMQIHVVPVNYKRPCTIWGSHSGSYVEFYLLGCNAV
jgi:hypothetical protein